MRRWFMVVLPLLALSGVVGGAQTRDDLVGRAAAYVERYYDRAQSLLATESIVIRPIDRGRDHEGYVWRMTNEVRFERGATALAPPRMTRRLISAKTPELGSPYQADCIEQSSFSIDPLALLLPTQRPKFRFTTGRRETVEGVRLDRIDFTPLTREPPIVDWQRRCGIIRSGGSTRGRVWVEPASGEVVRFEDELPRSVKVPGPPDKNAPSEFILKQFDTTIDYKRVSFTDPEETLLLPSRVETISAVEGSSTPRIRITHTFSDYRRFLTSGRVLP